MKFPFDDKHSNEFKEVLRVAQEYASDNNHEQVGKYHLLIAVLEDNNELNKLFSSLELDLRSAKMFCQEKFGALTRITKSNLTTLDKEAEIIFKESNKIRRKLKSDLFVPIHLLLSLVKKDAFFNGSELKKINIDYDVIFSTYTERVPSGGRKQGGGIGNPNDILSKFCVNKTTLAKNGELEPLIGRDRELREIYDVLGRKKKRNVILKGEPGVGKSTLIDGLAQSIINKEVPSFLEQTNLLTLDIGALLAGASYRGELEDRIKKIIQALQQISNPVLFVDEIHLLVDKDGPLGGGFINILKPELASDRLTIIGATTNDEYRKIIEKDKAFRRRFAIISISEPTEEEAIEIVEGLISDYEKFHGLEAEPNLAKTIVQLANRYLGEQKLPDSAIDLIDRTFAAVKTAINTTEKTLFKVKELFDNLTDKKDNQKLQNIQRLLKNKTNPLIFQQLKTVELSNQNKLIDLAKLIPMQIKEIANLVAKKGAFVSEDDVAAMISVITNIPIGKIQSNEKERLANIEKELRKRVVGQDHALELVADSIRQFRTGLEEPGKPASFFLLGPTGTGKTELAKTLATFLFDNQDSLIRFDMSEYRSEQSGELLLGAPPGYVGYNEGGILINKIREKPFSIVLFDEIEKAHSSIYKIFLRLLDEGTITDRQNRIGDFSNATLLFTSNLGGEEIIAFLDKEKRLPSTKEIEAIMTDEAYWASKNKMHYSKEFLARITSLVPFSPIIPEVAFKILQIQLSKLKKQLQKRKITLDISENALKQLLQEGFNPLLGARPLKSIIRHKIRTPIANLLVSSDKKPDKIKIDFKAGNWVVK